MSYKIVTNKLGSKVVLRVWGNTNIAVSDLALSTNEIVTAAHITQLLGATEGAGEFTYWRANTSDANNRILRVASQDNAYIDLAGNGLTPDKDLQTANIIFVVGTANTNMTVEFRKTSNFSTEY